MEPGNYLKETLLWDVSALVAFVKHYCAVALKLEKPTPGQNGRTTIIMTITTIISAGTSLAMR